MTATENELILPDMIDKSIYLEPTNYTEVFNIICTMKDKTGGVDRINVRTFKCISIFACLPLAHIYNIRILHSTWPKILKMDEILPIHKSGTKHSMARYRPIAHFKSN